MLHGRIIGLGITESLLFGVVFLRVCSQFLYFFFVCLNFGSEMYIYELVRLCFLVSNST